MTSGVSAQEMHRVWETDGCPAPGKAAEPGHGRGGHEIRPSWACSLLAPLSGLSGGVGSIPQGLQGKAGLSSPGPHAPIREEPLPISPLSTGFETDLKTLICLFIFRSNNSLAV